MIFGIRYRQLKNGTIPKLKYTERAGVAEAKEIIIQRFISPTSITTFGFFITFKQDQKIIPKTKETANTERLNDNGT